MTALAGLRGTGDWGTDERPKNFREAILFYEPNGGAPLTALMAKTGKQTKDDPEFAWWAEPVTITRLQLALSASLGASDTLFTVDSPDPTASTPAANWGVAQHLAPGDILMVEPAEASFSTTEYIEVLTVISDTQFTARRGACGSTAGTIANDVWLLRVGTAFAEGTAAPRAATRNPIKYSNYTQIFKTTYDITRTAANTRIRTGKDPLSNERKRRMTDHSIEMELAFMFGRKSETVGDNGKPKRTTDGLRRQIPTQNTTIFTGALSFTGSSNNFLDAVYKVFDWKTGAGDTRIAFAGNGALNIMNKKAATETNVRFNMEHTIKQYGMEFREFILPQGRLLIRTHPLMNQHSVYTNSMFIVDFSAIKWCPLRGGDTKSFDNVQAKDDDSVRGYWLTEAGLMVDYGGLSCGYLGGFSMT